MAIDTEDRYERELEREGGEREMVRREGREFDAQEALEESAGGLYEDFSEARDRELEDMRGRQVGAGRLKTGFGFEDQDRLMEEMERNFQRELVNRALDAEQMNLRNLEGRRRASNRYLDMLTSEREREEREEGRLWEAGGQVLGTAAGLAL